MASTNWFGAMPRLLLLWLLLTSGNRSTYAQESSTEADDPYKCTRDRPCASGCCGSLDDEGVGVCGLGPKFCGDGCVSSCDSKSQCDPGWGLEWSEASACPLNVCCSEFGFCGPSPEFCGGKTVASPECSGRSAEARVIGYYESWNLQTRKCDKMDPSQIPLGWYTHINFAFALLDPETFHIQDMDDQTGKLYRAVTGLRAIQPELEIWIAIGGWAMNDPGPHQRTFSDLAASEASQDDFFESLLTFMQDNDFDGVDLDWEYPVADDRGGSESDFDGFVTLVRRLRERLNNSGRQYGLSLTLPSSYWYLKGFDIVNLEPWIEFFNIMSYDIHGIWDENITSIGNFAYPHTNLTEISEAMELLWRNNINPERVNMGLGFYGRSYTMADKSCMSVGCEFSDPGKKAECTDIEGVLSATEIARLVNQTDVQTTFSEAEALKIVTWNDQWVSWDDAQTLKLKMEFANRRCLGGVLVWAVDLDDGSMVEALGSGMQRPKADIFPRVTRTLVEEPPFVPEETT